MLEPSFFEQAPIPIMRLLNDLENYTVLEIAKRIHALEKRRLELDPDNYNKLTLSNTYRLERLQSVDIFQVDFKQKLAETTEKTLNEIDVLFTNTAQTAHRYDRAAFAERLNRFVVNEKIGYLGEDEIQKKVFAAGLKQYIPYKDNPFLQQITKAISEQTKDTFRNMTRTVGFTTRMGKFLPPREMFMHVLAIGEAKVVAGLTDYNSAIKETVKELVDSGLKTVEYPYAKPWSLESSVRANVLTGIRQLASEVTWRNTDDLGARYVETTMHSGSRESHQKWQGRIFALNGSVAEIRAKADLIHEADKGVKAMRTAERAADIIRPNAGL